MHCKKKSAEQGKPRKMGNGQFFPAEFSDLSPAAVTNIPSKNNGPIESRFFSVVTMGMQHKAISGQVNEVAVANKMCIWIVPGF